jgi:hypothetical protein
MMLFKAVIPTPNYEDTRAMFSRDLARRSDILVLYISYTKETESSIEIQIKGSHIDDAGNGENWYLPSSVDKLGVVTVSPVYQVLTPGKFRLEIPVGLEQDKIRVSVKRTGGVGKIGSITMYAF